MIRSWPPGCQFRAPLIFGYEPNRTWPTTLGRPGFVACRSDRQLMSTSRCVLHHVTTSVFSFQPVQANALKSLTQYEGRPEGLSLQHGGEGFHQRAQTAFRHGWDQVIEHAPLTEQ